MFVKKYLQNGKLLKTKATIYVNKEQNYAVYNNIEVSLKYKNENDLKKIYDTLIRGTNAFLETTT